jgi:hypothetical protein
MSKLPLMLLDWKKIPDVKYDGKSGFSLWKTLEQNGIRTRLVEHSENFIADHWCEKGHIIYCIEGEITIKLKNEKSFSLKKGMSLILSDNTDSHFVTSEKGAKLFIVDGDFLI